MLPPSFPRRELLRLLGAGLVAGLGSACVGRAGDESVTDPAALRLLHSSGRLAARPAKVSPREPPPCGIVRLGLSGSERDGVVYRPATLRADRPAPLLLLLHGATGSGSRAIQVFKHLADERGLLLLAPDSRAYTWDIVLGGFGPDIESVDRALVAVFRQQNIDPARVAVGGFSDGASYALTLGLANGDLFSRVLAFSPGFVADVIRRGSPRFFVSHGTRDTILPIETCGRRIAREFRELGYHIRFLEFDGGHGIPAAVAEAAVDWLVKPA
ncbi:MAG: alpha/beta hydrolase [Gemmatimonadales bacterium]